MGILNPVYQSGYATPATTIVSTTGNAYTTVTDGTTSCMDCIRGQASGQQTVWCSGGWNYEYKSLPLADPYPIAN